MFNIPATLRGASDFVYPNPIGQSAMFDRVSGSYLTRTLSGDSDSMRKATFSAWLKRSTISFSSQRYVFFWSGETGATGYVIHLELDSLDRLIIYQHGSGTPALSSNGVFRDCSGWYHIVVAYDTTQATASNRVKVYINGDLYTDWGGAAYLPQNSDCGWGSGDLQRIGNYASGTYQMNGYLADVHWCDGTQYTANDFGKLQKGIWVPKTFTGSYGSEGFHYTFGNSSALGDDTSGNNNDATVNGMGTDHQVLDSPTNNYATLDWNNGFHNGTYPLHEGGLEHHNAASTWLHSQGTFVMKTGKWYWEFTNGSDSQHNCFGICAQGERSGDNQLTSGTTQFIGYAEGWGMLSNSGVWVKWNNNSGTAVSPNTLAANDIIMVALDCDANKVWFGKNGTWFNSGNPATGANAAYSNVYCNKYDIVACQATHTNVTNKVNFGQRTFAHTPPTGFKSCCTGNLEEPTVVKSSGAFDVVTYVGTGAVRNITSLNFKPDFVWTKKRSGDATLRNHKIVDSVRGATIQLLPDVTNAETTVAEGLKSFDSNGFTLGNSAGWNYVGDNYVAWCMRKGSQYGFDIQTYTGNGAAGKTVSHNLGAVPELVIVKNRDAALNWRVYHKHALNKSDPHTDSGVLDTTAAWTDSNLYWNDTAPTSSVVTLGSSSDVNQNTADHVMYLWRSIEGFSKVFSYEGNGNVIGPYVYCGFRPRFILIKNADGANAWQIYDTERDSAILTPISHWLLPDQNAMEDTGGANLIDVMSNGFKIKATGAAYNTNNATFVGLAFADQPGKYSHAR